MKEKNDPRLCRAMQFAFGYMNLDMPEEAMRELSALSVEQQFLPEILSLKGQAFLMLADWQHAANTAKDGHERYPEISDFYVQQALACEQLGELRRAISIWQSSPEEVRGSGFCHYNIARCEAQLGNIISAEQHMREALKLEPKLKSHLKDDPLLRILPKMPARIK